MCLHQTLDFIGRDAMSAIPEATTNMSIISVSQMGENADCFQHRTGQMCLC